MLWALVLEYQYVKMNENLSFVRCFGFVHLVVVVRLWILCFSLFSVRFPSVCRTLR